jgi:flagella basal body P-ring formation protein FlgA
MKRSVIVLLVIALVLVARLAAHSATAKVVFRAESEVTPGSAVYLKDVASIQASSKMAVKLSEVNVGAAPLAGRSRTVDVAYLKQKISYQTHNAEVTVSGPSQIKMTGKCTKITAQELTEAAKQYALDNLPKDNREYDVSVDAITKDIIAPASLEVKIKPEQLSDDLHPGLNPLRLNIEADGRVISTTFASVRVKMTAMVLVASDTIQKGSPLTGSNTIWDKRDVTKLADAIISKGDESTGDWVAKRTIRAGNILTNADVESPAAVSKGDNISLVVRCGGVVLHTSAEAKQDGKIGDTIRVLALTSTGEVRAKVTEPGVAEITR